MTKLNAVQEAFEIARLENIEMEDLADKLKLLEWGRWSRTGLDRLGYPRQLKFQAKGSWEQDLRKLVGNITDDEGLRIDRAVAELGAKHGHHYRIVIETIYKNGTPWADLPGKLGIATNTIRKYQNQALGMLKILLAQ
jgi:hypothetical protein